jgi:antirestriction protein ArdC
MYVTCHCQKGRNEEDPPMSKKPPRKDAPKFNLYQVVTDRIIASLKAGVIPWEKSWKALQHAGGPFPRPERTL